MTRSERRLQYRREVWALTGLSRHEVPGRKSGYTLDHIISVRFGFNQNLPAELIGSRPNLVWMDANDNIHKGSRMTPRGIELLRAWGFTGLAEVWDGRISR